MEDTQLHSVLKQQTLVSKISLPIDGDIQLGFRRFNARQR